MSADTTVSCDCGSVEIRLSGVPRVRGHCHCQACRTLLNTPYHSVTAWNPEQVSVSKGDDLLKEFQHPTLSMQRVFCTCCGEVMYNTNGMGWKVVSQHLLTKNNGGVLPEEFPSLSHFHYDGRIVEIDDHLPKKS